MHLNLLLVGVVLLAGLLAGAGTLHSPLANGQDLEELFGRSGFGKLQDVAVEADAVFFVDELSGRGQLRVTLRIDEGWHVYSLTQTPPPHGPLPTKIKVGRSDDYQITGDFEPDSPPHVETSYPGFSVPVEYHKNSVTWTAPMRWLEGVDPKGLKIPIRLNGQVCLSSQCNLFNESIEATFGGFLPSSQESSGKFVAEMSHAAWYGSVSMRGIDAGHSVAVTITAEPQEDFHIYRYSDQPIDAEGWRPTLVVFNNLEELLVSGPEVDGATTAHPSLGEVAGYHKTPVTWTFRITAPAKMEKPGDRIIRGQIGFMTCTESQCDAPAGISFEFDLTVGETVAGPASIRFSNQGEYADVVRALMNSRTPKLRSAGEWAGLPAISVMGLAFLAGLILNIMPCVLPVIGIKIMSFVSQSGASPGRLILLNAVFSLGIIAVFLVLATLAVFFGFGWGDLYKSNTFTIVMVSVLFVFALSFLGVWEIPLPGFVGSAGGKVQQQEGLLAAFIKGNFTTILATPCSGPLLVPAIVWAVAQPAWVCYLVFAAMGVGMAFPYLLIGAIPSLARLLPKPGPWMQTFKVLMGFALMGAVVFFFGSVSEKYASATLTFLVFLGMACWLVGQIELTAELRQRIWGWVKGLAVVSLGAVFAFYILIPRHELDWEPYSRAKLERYLVEGRPVFVDATADWCATCKSNEFAALNRRVTKSFFAKNKIVAMKADNTENSPEINELLDRLGNTQHGLPYYALFMPDKPDEPLHFGGVTFIRPEDFLKRIRGQFDASNRRERLADEHAKDAVKTTLAK